MILKIIIAGPLPNKKKSGGVAVFTENIAKEASRQGNSVLLLTNKVGYKKKYRGNIVIKNVWDIKSIKEFSPDIVISSLQFSLIICLYRINCVKIHILHGFTTFSFYSMLKVFLMHFVDLIVRKKFTYIIANSEYTSYINRVIFNIKSDGISYIGLSNKQLKEITYFSMMRKKRQGLLYVGRVVKAKNIELAIQAFNSIEDERKNFFKIIGYGSNYQYLYKNYASNNVLFRGAVSYSEIMNEYFSSKVFISLNDAEPFGITYIEALASGLFVIAPNRGGQVELLRKFPDRCRLVDISNISTINEAIKEGLNSDLEPLTINDLNEFSYSKTLEQIIRIAFKGRG